MYDRTSIELRYEAHEARVERVNREGWKYEQPAPARQVRERLAAALVALATRLAPSLPPAGVADEPVVNVTQS